MTKKLIIGMFSLFLLSSCGKVISNGKIDRDCSGTYLELNDKDYFICNPAIVESYPDGSEISVRYRFKSECESNPNLETCFLYHENHGFVKILEIKK